MSNFNLWKRHFNISLLNNIGSKLMVRYSQVKVFPEFKDVFKAFDLCSPDNLKLIIIGQDPYSDGSATGIAFGNNTDDETKVSPSLKVIKESIINYEIPHINVNFDNTLESWCSQGILLLNSALTVETGRPGSHLDLWREFISDFLHNFSWCNPGIVYLLLGKEAQSFKPYIHNNNTILEDKHPSWYVRNEKKVDYDLFPKIAHIIYMQTGYKINWYGKQEDKECY